MEEKERKEIAGTMIVPSIDMSKVQEYANQYAMEGMRKALSDDFEDIVCPDSDFRD